MIYRQNWLDVRAYLYHMERARQVDPETVKRARGHLRHLLEWADETPFTNVRNMDPTFPVYLLTARSDGKQKTLAPASITKCLANARQYYTFARSEWSGRYRSISESWIEMLQPPRQVRLESRLPVRQLYNLEDVLKIAAVSTETLRQERGRIAVCMLFLSGMRAEALASLPISCVDLDVGEIAQLPEAGVRTKNRKAAITFLLPIPELFEVVRSWDRRVRRLPPSALWYATLTRDGMTLTATMRAFQKRYTVVEHDVKIICELAGVPYLSPHKLRHGHAVYALKRAKDMATFKAISQNLMHKSAVITDQVYGKLIANDVQDIIGNLGKKRYTKLDDQLAELLALLQQASSHQLRR